MRILHGHRGSVNGVDSFGDTIVSASGDRTVKLWSISQGACVRTIEESRSLACIKLDGTSVLYGGRHGSVAIYSDRLKRSQARLHGHKKLVRGVQSRLGCKSLGVVASASHDGNVILWTRSRKGIWQSRVLNNGTPSIRKTFSSPPAPHTCAPRGARDRSLSKSIPTSAPREDDNIMSNTASMFGVDLNHRYLVSCSESSIISGWDFAVGDVDIIERF